MAPVGRTSRPSPAAAASATTGIDPDEASTKTYALSATSSIIVKYAIVSSYTWKRDAMSG